MDHREPPGMILWVHRLAYAGLALALLCVLAVMFSGFGHRFGWWHYRFAFSILGWAAYSALVIAGVSLALAAVVAWYRIWRPFALALLAVAMTLGTAAVPWSYLRVARAVPPIHDISTDTQDPPPFVAVLPLRASSPNASAYGGTAIAEQQRRAYPDIVPLQSSLAPARIFPLVEAVARSLNWEIVAVAPEEGRLEATDTTFWYGFKDDIVVRVARERSGSRIDVRSVSRAGRSDLGVNAARVRSFLQRLAAQLQSHES